MKINMPVTNNEVTFSESEVLVSKTDLKGILTYVNREFLEISGFGIDELIGKNHNVVRHPDMPQEAFRDLWDTLKKGRPWTALVKNRCKNGDFYWVIANVTPIWENGSVVGYMSVRSKPNRDEIAQASALYAKMKEHKSMKLDEGHPVTLCRRLNLLNKFSLPIKFMIPGVLFLGVGALVVSMILDLGKEGDFTQQELRGVDYLESILPVIKFTQKHRGLTAGALEGDQNANSQLPQVSNSLEKALENLTKMEQGEGAVLGVSSEYSASVEGVKRLLNSSPTDATTSFAQHTEVVNALFRLKQAVGDKSNLILDPQLDSYYLMDLAMLRIPELGEITGKLRGMGNGIISSGKHSPEQMRRLIELNASLAYYTSSLNASLNSLAGANGSEAEKLSSNANALQKSLEVFSKAVADLLEQMRQDQGFSLNAMAYFQLGTDVIDMLDQMNDKCIPQLKTLLQDRYDGINYSINVRLISVVIALIFAYFVAFVVMRQVIRSARASGQHAIAMAQGDFSTIINPNSLDEMGHLMRALKMMQINLNFNLIDARVQAEEALRIQNALDSASANLIVANDAHVIVYVNPAVEKMLKEAEDDIRKELPKFSADNLVGQSIDVFHKKPEHQRTMLERLKSPYSATISIGRRTFDLLAAPVFNNDNVRIGTVVEWKDRTLEMAIEKEITTLVNAATKGDLSRRLDASSKTGFFELISNNLNQLLDVCEKVVDDVIVVFSSLAKGDLTKQINNNYDGAFARLKEDANLTVENLTQIIQQVLDAASQVGSAAQEIAQGNTDLSQRTEEQASSLEETASGMEELTNTVKQNAKDANVVNELAQSMVHQAEQGRGVVSAAVEAMNEISNSSRRISDIIGVIDEIAFQTNLLALNAAVEAARAGEQGRGFAVVASEVRNLAQRSAAAAKEIKSLIHDSVEKVGDGSRLVDKSGTTLMSMIDAVRKVTELVGNIATASQEQASGIEEVSKAVAQMDQMTQQNAALVEEAAASGESLEEQAAGLNKLMQFFTTNEHQITDKRYVMDTVVKAKGKDKFNAGGAVNKAKPASKFESSFETDDEDWQEF